MAGNGTRDVTAPDGRTLRVVEAGAADGPTLLVHHGTPSAGSFYRPEVESAERLGARLVAYDRPGYGCSTPSPGRSVADAAGDVAAILDDLGVERFATYGISGGGPHALACAALLPERCAAAASICGIAPADAPDLDMTAGMGEGNVAEFAAAAEGREALTAYCERDAAGITGAEPEQLRDAMRPHLSEVDAAAMTGELAAYLLESARRGLAPGVGGWVDDDFAFLAPWGFDVGAIGVPALVWQGRQDLMVPPSHGEWLLDHVSGAEGEVFPDEGHLTLGSQRHHELHAWLAERLV
jgi:pimeloyl-ACP methyl ester carboxylesterase